MQYEHEQMKGTALDTSRTIALFDEADNQIDQLERKLNIVLSPETPSTVEEEVNHGSNEVQRRIMRIISGLNYLAGRIDL